MKDDKKYKSWVNAVRRESKRYPLLKKCKGQFNEEMLKHYYLLGFSPIDACNDMLTVT